MQARLQTALMGGLIVGVLGCSSCTPLATEVPALESAGRVEPGLSVAPEGDSVPVSAQIVVSFAEGVPPDIIDTDRQGLRIPLMLTPDPGCSWRKLDDLRVACDVKSAARLAAATEYRVSVLPGWKTAGGRQVTTSFEHRFRTLAPTIVFSYLLGHDSPGEPYFVVFTNTPVREQSLIAALKISAATGATTFPLRVVPANTPVLAPNSAARIQYSVPYDSFEPIPGPLSEDPRYYVVAPSQPLPPGLYQLAVTPGLNARTGTVAGTEQRTLQAFESYGDFAFRGVYCRPDGTKDRTQDRVRYSPQSDSKCQRGSVQLEFSSAVAANTLNESTRIGGPGFVQGYLTASDENRTAKPDPLLRSGAEELRWTLSEIAYGSTYRVRIDRLQDQFGRQLQQPVDVSIRVGAQMPSLSVPRGMLVFENDSSADVTIATVNADAPVLLQWRDMAGREQQASFPAAAQPNDLLHVRRATNGPVVANNQWIRGRIASRMLNRGMEDLAEGTSVLTPENAFLAQRTAFNVQWLGGLGSGLVWVTTLRDAQPVQGASVEIFRGQLGSAPTGPLASAVTDANGLARIEYRWPEQVPAAGASEHYIEVKRGVQRAWLPWASYSSSSCGGCDPAFPRTGVAEYRVLALPSQPIYDPGEWVQVVLVARQFDQGGNRPLTHGSYQLEFLENDAVMADLPRIAIEWSQFGTAQFSVRLPDTLRSNAIGMRLTAIDSPRVAAIDAGRLMVSPTQKPLHKVDTWVQQTSAGVAVEVAATLFAGGAYVNAPVEILAQLTPSYIEDAITKYPGFEFSQTALQIPYFMELEPVAGTTDRAGQFQQEFTIDAERYYSAQLHYEATVEDLAGRRLAARSSQRFFLRDRFIGINFANGPFTTRKPAVMQAVVVGSDGEQVKGAVATLQIAFNAAQTLRAAPQSWRTLRECTLRTGTAPVRCEFQPAASGFYRVSGSVKDSRGRWQRSEQVRFIEVDDQAASLPPYRYDQVELKAPQAVYVGDTIEVELAADFERSTALVSLLTDRVLDAKVYNLGRGRKKLSIQVTAAMFPAFTVQAAVQVPRLGHLTQEQLRRLGDTLRPALHQTSASVNVYERTLPKPLALSVDRKSYAPGETASIQVHNQDPTSSIEVSLLVVDRSLLSLVESDPSLYSIDPWELWMAPTQLSLIRRESLLGYALQGESAYGLLPLPRRPVAQDPSAGPAAFVAGPSFGSDAESSTGALGKARSDFRSVALWQPRVVLQPGESQQVPVKFPDNVGQWSVLAIALDTGHRLQSLRQEVTVTKPLLVAPLLPSQLIAGDQFDAQFSVTNLATQTVQASWAQEISGPLQRRDGATAASLTLEPNEPVLVNIPLAASASGAARIKFGALAQGGVQDAIDIALPIQSAQTTESLVEVGQLQGGGRTRRVALQLPADTTPGSGKLDLYVGRGGADLIAGAIAFARDYPHSCWEQQLTRAVSAALYVKLRETMDPGFAWPQAQQVITTALASSAKFQADDGGMTFFDRSRQYANAYLTAYTVVAFDWLRQLGYEAPQPTEQRASEYLLEFNRQHPDQLQQWAAALPLLTQRGQIDAARLEQMIATQPAADVVTRSYLYSAVLRSPAPDLRARLEPVLSRELSRKLYFDQGAASLPLVSNEVAQCATIINLLGAENPRALGGQITGLIRTLQERASRRSRWGTTHENAFCAKALWDYQQFAQRSGKFAPVEVAAALNGHTLGNVSLSGAQSQLQLLSQPASAAGAQRLEILPTGEGVADYRAVLTYQRPAAAQRVQASGFSLARRYQVRRGQAWVDVKQDMSVERSDLLRVNLDIVVPTARTLVVLQDPIPAGVEILNPLFTTTSQAELAAGNEGNANQAQYFDHRAVRLDSMNYYAENLPAGRHQLSYLVRAIAAGEFTALPSRIEEMYRPEIFGSAELFRLKVQQPLRR